MCGIVGLHLKVPALEPELGALVTPMMDCMGSRGADSSGLAVFSTPLPTGRFRYSVRVGSAEGSDAEADLRALIDELATATGQPVECERRRPDGAVLAATDDVDLVNRALRHIRPDAVVMGFGRSLEIVKDVGSPREVCDRFRIAERGGFQAVGHTRMATESAVTTDHSHPFAPTHDLAVVHNGSFSNPATVRRKLEEEGLRFVTDNDTEVAARLIGRELSRGSGVEAALKEVGNEMDGFYTLLVATDHEIAVVRDSFACKPLVVAETDEYVAFTSEYIAMATLPGIESAHVFEPKPEEIHAWRRA
jgi:methylamine---glutamate N-methyltransferase subunit A